jgi:DNA mismatch repair protein MutL
MADVIQLLPDSIANQIAAGEVVQRPASVVKELMENAIDAGSNSVKLIVKEAGKILIQVIDDGCGMSETDARLSFERHATSKIRHAKDLFAIRTMGFRGEALASIAAVAQVELRTRQSKNELGTRIVMEDSAVKEQEACQTPVGSSFAVKNLFYNVPARRNFLKSNTVEMKHIFDEFQHIALANPEIFLTLHHNNAEIFHLQSGNLRQRIVSIFGNSYNARLVPVSEETDVVRINGFIGKPETAKKTRGEQFFFVNQRYIKSGYLHHAVMAGYEEVIAADTHPFYVLFLEIDPSKIDVNVHPTKQEIKFDDERLIYDYLRVAVRHALGQHSITPRLDFGQEASFQMYATNPLPKNTVISEEKDTLKKDIFSKKDGSPSKKPMPTPLQNDNLRNWRVLYEGLNTAFEADKGKDSTAESMALPLVEPESVRMISKASSQEGDEEIDYDNPLTFTNVQKDPFQIHGIYILSQIKSGFLLIDQHAAHERVLYEEYAAKLTSKKVAIQKQLFPKTFILSNADAAFLKDILPDINALGFDIQPFGGNSFILHGIPAELTSQLTGQHDEQKWIETLLEQGKESSTLKLNLSDGVARAMAKSSAVKRGQTLSVLEMKDLIDRLFACAMPYKSPSGYGCFTTFELGDLLKYFL